MNLVGADILGNVKLVSWEIRREGEAKPTLHEVDPDARFGKGAKFTFVDPVVSSMKSARGEN